MKAIETIYKGFRFRSRLEARWAVFYDSLGISWEYEKEGFDLGKIGFYLPDFYIPHLDSWIEIKGERIGDGSLQCCEDLSEQSGKNVYVFFGSIRENMECPMGEVWFGRFGGAWDNCQCWCECPDCGNFGITFKGKADRLSCKQPIGKCPTEKPNGDRGHNSNSPNLIRAYLNAQSSRFEYGESGFRNGYSICR